MTDQVLGLVLVTTAIVGFLLLYLYREGDR